MSFFLANLCYFAVEFCSNLNFDLFVDEFLLAEPFPSHRHYTRMSHRVKLKLPGPRRGCSTCCLPFPKTRKRRIK